MSLCPNCRRINVPNLIAELDHLPQWWEQVSRSSPRGMLHMNDARTLPASASAGCPLCGLILDAVLQNMNGSSPFQTEPDSPIPTQKRTIQELQHVLADQPVYLRPNYDPRKPSFPERGAEGAWHVRGMKAFVPVDHGVVTGWVRLFAYGDSPAGVSCDVIGRPPLSSSDSPEAFHLIERWMSTCLTQHELCRETLSGSVIDESTPPILPTRVVYVGPPNKAISPRLVETQGKRGHYVALSHCWGRPSHRPLITTKTTLLDHLTAIAWEVIPRTYQDAISATHRLGFEYIWIDSLCIIQDSHADWLSESKRMGDVYQHARLTIAASHAADSSQPCFFPRGPALPAIELPHVTPAGETAGSIFASLLPTDYHAISPEFGTLAYRAWGTQEWLLSRRMVFYTAGCLVWSCKVISQRETGGSFHSTARNPRWKIIVEKYSARLLTKPTDRLIALEGIRSALGTKNPDDTYCFGLWKNSMPDQLLWYCLKPAERSKSALHLPTWTWASTLGGVRFLGIQGAKNTCGGFRFDEATSSLGIRGAVRKVSSIEPLARASEPDEVFEDIPRDTVPSEMLCSLRENGAPIGWCALDEPADVQSEIFCLRLMSRVTRARGDGVTEARYAEWVLLLRQTQGPGNYYERVGVGTISTAVPWFENRISAHVDVR